jgi:hypothetical protein
MGIYENGKRNGWSYNNKTLKENIENNKHVNKVRKKLMEKKLKRNLQK